MVLINGQQEALQRNIPPMAQGPTPPMGAPQGQGGEMSQQLQAAAQAIMAINDPGELAAIAMLVQRKGEELQGGQGGGPGGPPAGPPGAMQGAPPMGPQGPPM